MRSHVSSIPFCIALLLWFVGPTCLRAGEEPAAALPRLAVFPVRCTNTDPAVGRSVLLTLYDQAPLYPAFQVVERERVEDLLKETALSEGGFTDTETSRIGKLLGATHALLGEVLTVADQPKLVLRLAEVETGRVVMTAQKPVPRLDEIDAVAGDVLKDLMEGGPIYRASSVLSPDTKADRAFDGNRKTSWVAAEGNTAGSLEVWYKCPRLFSQAAIYVDTGDVGEGVPADFTLSYWDGREWKLLKDVAGNRRVGWRTRFSPTRSTRWRLQVTSIISNGKPVTVTEFELK
jgi:TolB-like protein